MTWDSACFLFNCSPKTAKTCLPWTYPSSLHCKAIDFCLRLHTVHEVTFNKLLSEEKRLQHSVEMIWIGRDITILWEVGDCLCLIAGYTASTLTASTCNLNNEEEGVGGWQWWWHGIDDVQFYQLFPVKSTHFLERNMLSLTRYLSTLFCVHI